MQVAATLLASLVFTRLSKTQALNDQWGFTCRLLFVPIFILFSLSKSAWQFSTVFVAFHFIVALSLPQIMGMFQREVEKSELRALGIARYSITCISGAIAAFASSVLLEDFGYENIYAFSAVMALVGALFFWRHLDSLSVKTVNNLN
jgi:predicted MFS family arabinose efflux permease